MDNNNYVKSKLSQYNSRINIMKILCHKSGGYCSKIKNLISLVLILLTATISIMTGIVDDTKIIKIPVVCINAFMALLIAFSRAYKYEERSANFSKHSQSYNKLSHDIDKQLNSGVSNEFLNLIISLYDNITDNITDSFPSHIVDSVKKEYDNINSRFLPSIMDKYTPKQSFLTDGNTSPDIKLSSKKQSNFLRHQSSSNSSENNSPLA